MEAVGIALSAHYADGLNVANFPHFPLLAVISQGRALLFKPERLGARRDTRHGDADGRYQDPQPDWADVVKRSGAKLE